MANPWQSLNGPVQLSRVLAGPPAETVATMPVRETPLEVISAETDSYSIRSGCRRKFDRPKHVLNQGLMPSSPQPLEFQTICSSESPKLALDTAPLAIIFRTEAPARGLASGVKMGDEPAPALEPVPRKLALYAPPSAPNHLCALLRAVSGRPALRFHAPVALLEYNGTEPYETETMQHPNIPPVLPRGVPPRRSVACSFENRRSMRVEKSLRPLGPRLHVMLPALN